MSPKPRLAMVFPVFGEKQEGSTDLLSTVKGRVISYLGLSDDCSACVQQLGNDPSCAFSLPLNTARMMVARHRVSALEPSDHGRSSSLRRLVGEPLSASAGRLPTCDGMFVECHVRARRPPRQRSHALPRLRNRLLPQRQQRFLARVAGPCDGKQLWSILVPPTPTDLAGACLPSLPLRDAGRNWST